MAPRAAALQADSTASKPVERRRFRRVRLDLPGRLFVPGDGRETECVIVDMSPGGAAIHADFTPEKSTHVVLYIDGFGRFEGNVVRVSDANFGVRFVCSALKRERTAEQLTLFMNRGLVDETALRRHDRTATEGLTRFTRADGELVPCEVLDLSLSGVSLKTEVKPPIGEIVLIGQMAGRIARHHDDGIGVEFIAAQPDKPQQPERLKAKLIAIR